MIRILPFLLYLWLVALHQVVLNDIFSIYGVVSINLAALVVLLVGLYKSELDACWFGFMVGLVAYAGATSALGWHALVMAGLGYLTFHLRAKVNLESLYSKLLLVFCGVLVHNAVTLIISGSDGAFYLMATRVLPGAVYTSVVAWIFFLFKEGRITFQKFKAIF